MCGSRNFRPGGVQALLPEKSSDKYVFFFFFFSPQIILLFYSGLSMVYFEENYNFSRFRGGPTFSRGGGPSFSRGSNFFQGGGEV